MTPSRFHAVIFDLGGVVFPSPFEAFDAYDVRYDLAPGTVRALIKTSSETGAWAALERGELTMPDFYDRLGTEAAAAGFELRAATLMQMFAGRPAPGPRWRVRSSASAPRACASPRSPTTGRALTNDRHRPAGNALGFDVIVESAVVGLRKPDPRIYELVLSKLDVDADAAVFLDDLGINLKPARAMGMTTIKVTDPAAALAELSGVLGFEVA